MTGWFGYGALMPDNVREVLVRFDDDQQARSTPQTRAKLQVQAVVGVILVLGWRFTGCGGFDRLLVIVC